MLFSFYQVYMRRGGGGAAAFRRQAHQQRHFNGNQHTAAEVRK